MNNRFSPTVVVETKTASGVVTRTRVPSDCHLVLMNDNMVTSFFARTELGYKLNYQQGRQRPEGWYTPAVMSSDDGYVIINQSHLEFAMGEAGYSISRADDVFRTLRRNY